MTQKNQLTEITGNIQVTPQYVRQATLQYKTFIKRAIVEALQNAFAEHPDPELAKTRIDIEYGTDRADFPAIVIKFYERDLNNIGVGHVEWGPSPADPNYPDGPFSLFVKYYHRLYKGDLEFEVYGLSSLDRDKVVDALVEVIAMADVTHEGTSFLNRIYESLGKTPFSQWHFIVLNTDLITGYGEQKEIAPWIPEDTLVYTASYRVPIIGEFYSLTPEVAAGTSMVKEVDVYPWNDRDSLDTPPADFPEGVIPSDKYLKFKGPPSVTFTGTLTKESDTITKVSSTTGLSIGMKITARGILDATIATIPTSESITMSEPATVTASESSIKANVVETKL